MHEHWRRAEREKKKGKTHRHHQLKGLLVHPHGRLVLLHHCEGSGFTSNLHENKHTHVSARTSMKNGRCASCYVLNRDCLVSSYRRRTGTIVQGTEGRRVLSLHSTFHISEQLCRAHRGRTHTQEADLTAHGNLVADGKQKAKSVC